VPITLNSTLLPIPTTITFRITLAGSAEDYAGAAQSTMQQQIALAAGVDAAKVTLTFVAGSVVVLVSIAVEDAQKAPSVASALSSTLSDAQTASALLGVAVETVSPPAVGANTDSDSGSTAAETTAGLAAGDAAAAATEAASTGVLVGGAAAASLLALLALTVCLGTARRWQRRRRRAKPISAFTVHRPGEMTRQIELDAPSPPVRWPVRTEGGRSPQVSATQGPDRAMATTRAAAQSALPPPAALPQPAPHAASLHYSQPAEAKGGMEADAALEASPRIDAFGSPFASPRSPFASPRSPAVDLQGDDPTATVQMI